MIVVRKMERNDMSMSPSLLELIKDDITRHEGYVDSIYLDSVGEKTFGIGHLITPSDPEATWPVGTPISNVRIEQAFVNDVRQAVEDAEKLCKNKTGEDLYVHPENVIRVLVNMAFNLGYARLGRFKRMWAAIAKGRYDEAAEEMEDSKWYGQVGRRSKELCRLMEWSSKE